MKIRLRGKAWSVLLKKPRGAMGLCLSPDRKIFIDPSLKPKLLLWTTLHEGLHATQDDLSEEAVEEVSEALADLLWRLGWRKT